jgi:hypothetical protein
LTVTFSSSALSTVRVGMEVIVAVIGVPFREVTAARRRTVGV